MALMLTLAPLKASSQFSYSLINGTRVMTPDVPLFNYKVYGIVPGQCLGADATNTIVSYACAGGAGNLPAGNGVVTVLSGVGHLAVQADLNPFLTAPGPIGSTTPNTINATTVTATSGAFGAVTSAGSTVCTPANGLCPSGGGGGGTSTVPPGFPQQLLGFTGPNTTFGVDGLAWDAFGLGGPSNAIFTKGEWWVAVSGYPTAGFTAQSIGLWHGANLNSLVPYSGNPIITNNHAAWDNACLEGPDLNTDASGNIYVSFLGFSSSCDGFGTGQIGIVSTSAASFPTGWSAITSTPQIAQGSLSWLYRPSIIEVSGHCLDYSNAGVSGNPVIVYFDTGAPCATSELSTSAWALAGTSIAHSQAWEGPSTYELQDPQVFQDPSGLYIMGYGGGGLLTAGYATTLTPLANNWVKLAANPLQAGNSNYGTGVGSLWLPRWTRDSTGQYWMMGNYNNTTGMSLWKAVGPSQSAGPSYASNSGTLSSSNPAWQSGVDGAGNYSIGATYPAAVAANAGYWTPAIAHLVIAPGFGGIGFGPAPPVNSGGNYSTTVSDAHYPMEWLNGTAQPSNEQLWRTFTRDDGAGNCAAGHSCWTVGVTNDAHTTVGTAIEITRNGNTITGVFLDGPTTVPALNTPTGNLQYLNLTGATAAGNTLGTIRNNTNAAFAGPTFFNSTGTAVGNLIYGNPGESALPWLTNKMGFGGVGGVHTCLWGGSQSECAIEIDGSNNVQIAHSLTGGNIPSLGGSLSAANITLGTGAGTGATFSVTGLDATHQVVLTTGTSPGAGGVIWQGAFTASRGHTSYCTMTPAMSIPATQWPTMNGAATATGYEVDASSIALAGGSVYTFNINCP